MSGKMIPFRPKPGDTLPPGYSLRADGIWFKRSSKDEEDEWHRLCSRLQVRAFARDDLGRGWGKLVEVIDLDGNVHSTVIPARLMAGNGIEAVAELLDLGLRLEPGTWARTALLRLLTSWIPSGRVRTTDRLGWTDDSFSAFVLGADRVIGRQDVYPLPNALSAAGAIRPCGAPEAWRGGVAAPCIGSPLLLVAASTAFVGPLLEPLGFEGGGLHLRGASSVGKTTALRVAASVWGAPGFMHSWRATDNGLEGVAAACNSTLCILDEIGEAPSHAVSNVAYMLANGVGKRRASKTGAVLPQSRWRVAILSSGEMTLSDKIAEGGGRAKAGQSVRLIDIPAGSWRFGAFETIHDAPDPASFARRLTDAAAVNHGTAGPAFVEALIENLPESLAEVRATMERFKARANESHAFAAEGQVERGVARFALIAAAGELATRLGLTGWPPGAAESAAMEILDLWIATRGGVEPEEKRRAIARIRAFLSEHGSARFEDLKPNSASQRISNRAGWRDKEWFYISADCWKQIHGGSDPTQAARYVRTAGYLRVEEEGRMTVRLLTGRDGRPRAYAVSREILGDDNGLADLRSHHRRNTPGQVGQVGQVGQR